jgi:hypothetical protein
MALAELELAVIFPTSFLPGTDSEELPKLLLFKGKLQKFKLFLHEWTFIPNSPEPIAEIEPGLKEIEDKIMNVGNGIGL